MGKLTSFYNFLGSSKPYFAMISLQFGYAGMNIITKVSLNRGMSHYVLVVYRHAFATAVIAPFAFIFERKEQPRITFRVFMQIFVLALLGPVIDQNFYYAGLKFTSPTFSCAMSNMLPAMTFVMAVIFRMEKVDIKKVRCQAKVVGTLVTVAGAMLMTLYKGPIVELIWTKHIHPHKSYGTSNNNGSSDKEWFLGSILLIIATFAWASLFVLQTKALETYNNHQLSLTSLVCFFGTLQAIAVTFVMEHKSSVWRIGWDMNLLAAAYAGIVTSSISYYVQGLVIKKKGPVFATAFSPLMMIVVAIMGSFILAEKIFLGGIIGSVLIVIGLYSVLWGKHKESQSNKREKEIMDPVKGVQSNGAVLMIEDIEANDVDLQKAEANNNKVVPSMVITIPNNVPEVPSMKAKQQDT
ncbi:WAT1-related protein [Tripterygium wilfordii]|uniref:WAT1-related protein n=1 Tax=Tripterygium wilfordii TaxID=458696 RepID=A0A7J7C5F6_TRIWF|nr:WAT1-related protein At5g07050-like [Tripterygium wilfordii]KAF5729342.1 WAT1-related protein [Tripterygium wilfordii]